MSLWCDSATQRSGERWWVFSFARNAAEHGQIPLKPRNCWHWAFMAAGEGGRRQEGVAKKTWKENHWHGIRGGNGVATFWLQQWKTVLVGKGPGLADLVAGDRSPKRCTHAVCTSSIRQSPGFSSRWQRFLSFKFLRSDPSITGMSFRTFWVGTLSFLSSSLTTPLVSEASFCAPTDGQHPPGRNTLHHARANPSQLFKEGKKMSKVRAGENWTV